MKFTRHGPVLWSDGQRALALRWVGSEPGTAGYLASLAIDRAQSWDQFESAVARWKVPSENLVYADTAGNIGEHSAGLAPIRKWTGLLPVPGAGSYEWSGFVPVSELPHFFNPKEGFVATANHKMIPDHYPYNVGFEWASPYRITRIRAVFENAKQNNHKMTMPDMAFLQNDVTSLPALEFQKLLKSTPLKDDPSLQSFFDWDGELGTRLRRGGIVRSLVGEDPNWPGRTVRKGGSQYQQLSGRYKDLPPDAILRILENPEKDLFGEDPSSGPQSASVRHSEIRPRADSPISSARTLHSGPGANSTPFASATRSTSNPAQRNCSTSARSPAPATNTRVNATGTSGDSYDQVSGASYREILDTSDWDRSRVVNTPGQSGQPGSPHYSDLMSLWDAGRYFPLLYSRKAVEGETTDRLTLEP